MHTGHSPLNETILALYRGCREQPPGEFKEWAMGLARTAVAFDSGIWVSVNVSSMFFQSAYLFRQPPEMLENYHRTIGLAGDNLGQAEFLNPAETIDSSVSLGREEFRRWSGYASHCQKYGMEQGLCTCQISRATGVPSFMCFYRADPDAPFSEEDRRTKQLLVPHMVEALRINLFSFVQRRKPELPIPRSVAICDSVGVIYEAEQRFVELVRCAHPDWCGPQLPGSAALMESIPKGRWLDGNQEFTVQPLEDLYLVTVTRPSALSQLTQRQRQIAELLIAGLSYKEIARQIGLSPSTITNHANGIYARLGIGGRMELVRLAGDSRAKAR
jgi:DNA-binding CsgD family transcriptional regulator